MIGDIVALAFEARGPEAAGRWFTIAEAATYLQLRATSSVRTLIQRGELRPDGRGGRGCAMFRQSTLDEFLAQRAQVGTARAPRSATLRGPASRDADARKQKTRHRRSSPSGSLRALVANWNGEDAKRAQPS